MNVGKNWLNSRVKEYEQAKENKEVKDEIAVINNPETGVFRGVDNEEVFDLIESIIGEYEKDTVDFLNKNAPMKQ